MSARWWTLAVWALAAASALFWGLKLFVKAPPAPPHTQVARPAAAAHGDLGRLLGIDPPPEVVAAPAEPAPDARFQLIGVVSPRAAQAAREGLALIAVDGKPAKAFRVGALVDGQNVLQSVSTRSATLGPRGGAALVALSIAPPPAAPTGMLPQALPPQALPPPALPPGVRPNFGASVPPPVRAVQMPRPAMLQPQPQPQPHYEQQQTDPQPPGQQDPEQTR